jgi:hypothetical protein
VTQFQTISVLFLWSDFDLHSGDKAITLSQPSSGVIYKVTWLGLMTIFVRYICNSNNLQSQ